MTEVLVVVTEMTQDNAILLLAAAEESGLSQEVVRTTQDGFLVPQQVADLAFPPSTTVSTEE